MPARVAVFLAFTTGFVLSFFFRSANAVIAGDLMRELSLDAAQLGLMTSLFFVVFALAQLPLGLALDRHGARRVTAILMLSAVAGSVLFATAQSFWQLAWGRALIGLGMAGNLMGALKALSGWFSARRFATVASLFVAIGASGALLAATPLVLLNEAVGWRAIFWGGAALTLLVAAVIALWGRDAPTAPRAGSSVAADGLATVFRHPAFWRMALLNFAMVGTLMAYQGLWIGPFLLDAIGLSPLAAGNLLLLLSSGVVLGYGVSGWLADRLGLKRVMVAASAAFFLIQAVLALAQASWPWWVLALLCTGFGFAGAFSVLIMAQLRLAFPLSMTGRAVTAANLFGIGGSALLQGALGLLISLFSPVAGNYPPLAYSAAFGATAALTLLALLLYLPLLRQGAASRAV
jgi:MFS family permease